MGWQKGPPPSGNRLKMKFKHILLLINKPHLIFGSCYDINAENLKSNHGRLLLRLPTFFQEWFYTKKLFLVLLFLVNLCICKAIFIKATFLYSLIFFSYSQMNWYTKYKKLFITHSSFCNGTYRLVVNYIDDNAHFVGQIIYTVMPFLGGVVEWSF